MAIQAIKDVSTVTPDGERRIHPIQGVIMRPAPTHVDQRGTMCEVNDNEWSINGSPIVSVSLYTIRPGVAKGWVVHRQHDDRNFLIQGRVKWVLYDDRSESPTVGQLLELHMSEYNRGLLVIPSGVFHAVQNVGDREAVIVDMPTVAYDHNNPDKYRLPLHNEMIPYRFEGVEFGW